MFILGEKNAQNALKWIRMVLKIVFFYSRWGGVQVGGYRSVL